MLDVYLIRHAESELNMQKQYVGGRSNHVPLSRNGNAQSILLAKRLKSDRILFDRVYCSTAKRAGQTAVPCCQEIGYPLDRIIYSEDTLELDQGEWEGKLRTDVYTPEVIEQIKADQWNFAAPGGESQRDVEDRMYDWIMKEIVAGYSPERDESIGIFGHGLAFKCLLRKIMDFDPRMTFKLVTDNASITQLRYNQYGWNVLRINDYSHLQDITIIRDRFADGS